jgi:hypothetical protein
MKVPDSCRVPTGIYYLGKNSDHFEIVQLDEQKYFQKLGFSHVENTVFAITGTVPPKQ